MIRANNGPFMNKGLSKAFMTRTRLRNKSLKNPNSENKFLYKKQRNYCINLLRKSKRDYYKNLDIKHITDNKMSLKTVKPLFSYKHNISRNITHVDQEVAQTMNESFSAKLVNLDIKGYTYVQSNETRTDPVNDALHKFKDHPSILKIKERVNVGEKFSFSLVNEHTIITEI